MKIGNISSVAFLIGQEGCKGCEDAKVFLENNEIPTQFVSIEDVGKYLGREIAICRKNNGVKQITVPMLIYKNTMYTGFDQEEYESIFAEERVGV